MGVYDSQIRSVKAKLAAKGRKVIMRRHNKPVPDNEYEWEYDEAQINEGEVPYTDYETNVLFLPQTGMKAFLGYITGTRIEVGEDYGLAPQLEFIPNLITEIYESTKAADDSSKTGLLRVVKAVIPFAPNGEVIFNTLQFEVNT